MKKGKLGLLLIGILLISILLSGCNVGKNKDLFTIKDIKKSGKLIMGTNADYPPFEFHALVDGKDEIVGFDIEIAKYIAEDLGVELVIDDMQFSGLLGALTTGRINMILACMNPTETRKEEAGFSDIYYEVDIGVITQKGKTAGINSIEDLEGKSIAVQMGTVQEEIANSIKDAEVVALDTNSDIVSAIKTNKYDFGLLESVVAQSYVIVNKDIEYIDTFTIKDDTGGVAIATQKGNDEFINYLNKIIKEIKEKGLMEKWFDDLYELSGEGLK